MEFALNDPVNDIGTETDLTVAGGCLRQDVSVQHVDDQRRYRCCTDIHHQTAGTDLFILSIKVIYKNIAAGTSDHALNLEVIFPKLIGKLF